jgi:GNAT superfamily N-acetyltransferase
VNKPVPAAIRPAILTDIPSLVSLIERKRIEQEREQPIFWRKAEDSAVKHAGYLHNLLQRDGIFAFVHETAGSIDGFVIGVQMTAPPVYDPGGPTCLIDDFTVADPALWSTVGRTLLEAAQAQARERGMVCMQVICGHYDEPKRSMLAAAGFPVASEWRVRPL